MKRFRNLAILALMVLSLAAILPTFAQDGMWSDNWQGDACPNAPDMTTALAQETLGEPVVRFSTYGCAFGWSGEAKPFNVPKDWVALDLSGDVGKIVQGTGAKINFTKVVLVYLPGDLTMTLDILMKIAGQKTDSVCALDPRWSVKTVTEAVSADPTHQIVLTKNSQEYCTFVARGGDWSTKLPVGMIVTLHPSGTPGTIHSGGEDDIVRMWRGDGSTTEQVFALTLRVNSGTPEDDAVNADVCLLWDKEIANGAMDVKPFLVLKGNLSECKYNPDMVRQVIREIGGTSMERNLKAFEKLNPFYVARYGEDIGVSPVTSTAIPVPSTEITPTLEVAQCVVSPYSQQGANLRGSAAQNGQLIGVLEFSKSYIVIGRNKDASWWRVSNGSQQGWVSAAVVQSAGVCLLVPEVS